MYIAQGKYRFSTPSETKVDALMQLITFNVFTIEDRIKVSIKTEGSISSDFTYQSTLITQPEALHDAILSHYKKLGIKLYQEIL